MKLQFDPWQEEVLKTEGNMVLRSGRQVGKSTVIAEKAARFALENPKKLIMIISKTERQAALLFQKILVNVHRINKKAIKMGKDRPTKHLMKLNNGATIHSLPAGDTGFGLMGFTIDLLIADEAAWINEEVWNSIIPALAITRGLIWLLSTPWLKKGYYYKCFSDPSFTAFHTRSTDCPRKNEAFLEQQKMNLTKSQWKQMYLGEFVDDDLQFFKNDLIEKCCVGKRPELITPGKYYLGCDVARMDKDQFTFEIVQKKKDKYYHVENIYTTEVTLPDSVRRIIQLNEKYNFRKEYIDSGGMGIAVCDMLREHPLNKRKVEEVNNATRMYELEGDEKTKLITKEVLYNNLKKMMEQGQIILLDDDHVKASLKSVMAESMPETGRLKFWGEDTHIIEGLVRACKCAISKGLNIYIC